jgi:hypothetical protein
MIVLIFLAVATAGTLCADGWVSPSKGRGTCSHHGGIYKPPAVVPQLPPPALRVPHPSPPPPEVVPKHAVPEGGELSLTVKAMLPFLSNKEAGEIWLEDTNTATQTGKLNNVDPNDRNKHTNLQDLVPPVWECTDGEDSDQVKFPCWSEDRSQCIPEWHSLMGLSCPVVCERPKAP